MHMVEQFEPAIAIANDKDIDDIFIPASPVSSSSTVKAPDANVDLHPLSTDNATLDLFRKIH